MNDPATAVRLGLASPVRGAAALAAALLLAGVGLAGCAGGKSATGQAAARTSAAGGQQGQRQGFGGGPAAAGLLAEIDGHVLQVQNPATGQVSVSYSTSTTFSQTTPATLAALKVGDCVTAIGQRSSSASPPSAGSAAPRPTDFPATSVQISAPTDGNCGFGGGRGVRPSGFPSGRPSSFPSGRPSGFPSGRPSGFPSGRPSGFPGRAGGGFGEFATGTVTVLGPGSMTVRSPARGQQAGTTVTVLLTGSTSYTRTGPATAAALRVGECVSATGKADSTGAVAASRIALSPAGPSGCSTGGFGRRPAASGSPTGA
ncbi:MAG TPA: DUF5666 domain-containing protein [Jatrophihabitans sp.]|nr:DUF5666 domain-containing protein [Jatrophihabitans sp.]